jgi:hypothetical protein
VTLKQRKNRKGGIEAPGTHEDAVTWTADRELDSWLDPDATAEFETDDHYFPLAPVDNGFKLRLELIKDSHALLKQFTSRELKALIDLKRNTSAKAWSLREDLVVLTLQLSNREIAELLKERNKEAVKKRLQLLKTKGVPKRQSPGPQSTAAE